MSQCWSGSGRDTFPPWTEVKSLCPELQFLWHHRNNLSADTNGVIWRKRSSNSHQLQLLIPKAGRQVKVISRLCYVLDQLSKMMLYNSFVECYFNYCAIIWHVCNKSDTFKLEKNTRKGFEGYHQRF